MDDLVTSQVLEAAAVVFRRPVNGADNFFAVGGDSLLAAVLAVALEEQLGIPVDPQLILTSPSLAATASALASGVDTIPGSRP